MHNSTITTTFVLLATLVMLAKCHSLITTIVFQIQQSLKNMTNMEIVIIANIQQTIRNMNAEQVHSKASL